MNEILILDRDLFLFINHLPHTKFLDSIALILSGVGSVGIIWFILGIALFLREEKRDTWFFAPLFLIGGLSYFVSEILLKPLVERIRPTAEIGAIIVGNQSTDPSFPSGHATIAFAMAVVLSRKKPKWKWLFYTLAIFISFSRIYLGKHYPLDVIGGALIGWGIGKMIYYGRKETI